MQLLRDIALFVEVVNSKSFTHAAQNLDMPASTLSRRISALEAEIGLRLLNRTTRRVETTPAGLAYYTRCAHLVEAARVAHEDISTQENTAKGLLRLSCSPDFATLYLPDVLTAFTQRYPRIDIELDLSPRIADLASEGLDAALRIGRLADSNLVARKLGELSLGLYAAPQYVAIAPPLQQPEDLAQHMCLRMGKQGRATQWRLYPVSPSTNHTPNTPTPHDARSVVVQGRFTARSVTLIRQLALRGAGIGAIDHCMARHDVQQGTLVPVLPDWQLASAPLHLVTPSRLMPARVRLFGDFLAAQLGYTTQPQPRANTAPL